MNSLKLGRVGVAIKALTTLPDPNASPKTTHSKQLLDKKTVHLDMPTSMLYTCMCMHVNVQHKGCRACGSILLLAIVDTSTQCPWPWLGLC